MIFDRCNDPVLVSADIEDRACAQKICMTKVTAHIYQALPPGLPRRKKPVQQGLLRIGVPFPELSQPFLADYSHRRAPETT
jgi:hypothetical protein